MVDYKIDNESRDRATEGRVERTKEHDLLEEDLGDLGDRCGLSSQPPQILPELIAHLSAQAPKLQILLIKLVTEPRYGCYSGKYSRLNSEHNDPVTYITFVLQVATLTTNYDAIKRAGAGNVTTSSFIVAD